MVPLGHTQSELGSWPLTQAPRGGPPRLLAGRAPWRGLRDARPRWCSVDRRPSISAPPLAWRRQPAPRGGDATCPEKMQVGGRHGLDRPHPTLTIRHGGRQPARGQGVPRFTVCRSTMATIILANARPVRLPSARKRGRGEGEIFCAAYPSVGRPLPTSERQKALFREGTHQEKDPTPFGWSPSARSARQQVRETCQRSSVSMPH